MSVAPDFSVFVQEIKNFRQFIKLKDLNNNISTENPLIKKSMKWD